MARGAISVGLSMVGVLLLGGCTGSAEPPPRPIPRATAEVSRPVPSPVPGPTASVAPVTAPVRPAEMEQSGEVGAAAAAEYFLRLFPYVMQSGDLEEWERISTTDCEFCSTVRGWVEGVHGEGGAYVGGGVIISSVETQPRDATLGGFPVRMAFSQDASRETDRDGREVDASQQYSGVATVDVVFSADGWAVLEVSMTEAG